MQVTFKKHDGTAEKTIDVSLDSQLGESREVAQMLLGLPENPACKLVLERTNKELDDSFTFQQASIQPNDKFILFPLNTASTNRENTTQDNVPTKTETKEAQASFNLKTLPTLLIASGIVGILVIGGLLYRQLQQQQILTAAQLRQEQSQREEAERQQEETRRQLEAQHTLTAAQLRQEQTKREEAERQREEAKRQLEAQQTLSDEQLPLGDFSDGNWLVSLWYENNTYYYRGQNIRTNDSLSLANPQISGDSQRRIYTWQNGDYDYQITWEPSDSSYIRLQVFSSEGKQVLNQLLKKSNY